jgi:PAS domain S-box-containing protein
MTTSGNSFSKTFRAQAARAGRVQGHSARLSPRAKPAFTLRQSVLFTLLLIFLVVLAAVGIGVSFFVTNSEKSAWHDRQLEATYGAARTIEAFLDHHIDTLEVVGLLESQYLRTDTDLLDQVIEQNPALQEIVVVDAAGNIIAASHRDENIMALPQLIAQSNWFLRTSTGEIYLGDVQLSAEDDPYLILAAPVQAGNIVAARVNMRILRDVVSSVRFGETGIAFIIDSEGSVIAHTNERVVLNDLRLGVSPDHIEDASAPMYAMSDERKGITHWHSHYANFDGKSVASLIMELPGTEWYVVAEVDETETNAASRMALLVLGGSIAGFALLVVFVTVRVLDRRLFGPIALLRVGAQRIGAGRFDHRIAPVGNNEIGQVATAFNEMASHLHARQKQLAAQTAALNEEIEQRRHAQAALQRARYELEAKVAARTRELRATNQQLQNELTQHRQAQESLATVEARLQHLLLTSPAIIFSIRLDEDLLVNYISSNIEDATGYSPEDYYADPRFAYQHIHPDDIPYINQQLGRLEEVERVSYDYRFRVSSGVYKWFHDDAVAVYGEDGKVREIVGSIVDIDERKRLEEEQAAARDRALEASRLKSEFLATVSHEIRTPLNGVIGMADLLLATPLNPEQLEYVKTMAYSADSLLVVINDVLDLSKVEAGKLILLETEFSPRHVAQSVVDLLLPRAREKGITMGVELAAELPQWVRGYEARLRQVLLNLVGNAVKFTEQGGVTVSTEIVRPAAQGTDEADDRRFLARFTVRDTGIGLDEANYGKLFQPFSQVDSSLARKYGGAGLGLAISKRLVELMGGEIGVESAPGKGSTFWFTIPLHRTEDAAGGDEPSVENQVVVSRPNAFVPVQQPAKEVVTNGNHQVLAGAAQPEILLVEDNQVNQMVALAQLKRLGYAVHAVNNGREAVEAVEHHAYAVILMDCQMPEMDGFEATRLIRALEERIGRRVPIIAMTANAMNGDREACLDAGMNDYLAKPIRAEELRSVLRLWIEE